MTKTYLGNDTNEYILNSGKTFVLNEQELQEFFEMYDHEDAIRDLEEQIDKSNDAYDEMENKYLDACSETNDAEARVELLEAQIEDLESHIQKLQSGIELQFTCLKKNKGFQELLFSDNNVEVILRNKQEIYSNTYKKYSIRIQEIKNED